MKILIIDDEPPILEMYKEKLTQEKHEVVTAAEGEAGLKKAKEAKPDIILLDLIMPIVNGLDILKQLKEDSSTKDVPVYLLTNIPEDSGATKGKQLGAAGYLFKAETEPAKLADFIAKLAK